MELNTNHTQQKGIAEINTEAISTEGLTPRSSITSTASTDIGPENPAILEPSLKDRINNFILDAFNAFDSSPQQLRKNSFALGITTIAMSTISFSLLESGNTLAGSVGLGVGILTGVASSTLHTHAKITEETTNRQN